MSHAGHVHGADGADARRLARGLALIVALMIAEIVAGILARSLALLSDAAHMLTDAGALMLSLAVVRLVRRPARGNLTFGLRRLEALSAQANGATLLVLAALIVYGGIRRLVAPPDTHGPAMVAIAAIGVVVNLLATRELAHADRTSLNIEGAFQHLLTDLFAFAATGAAGIVIVATGFDRADGVAALAIAAVFAYLTFEPGPVQPVPAKAEPAKPTAALAPTADPEMARLKQENALLNSIVTETRMEILRLRRRLIEL